MKNNQQFITNNILNAEKKRLILFFIVGGINTIFSYSLYVLFLYLQLHYAMASLLATIGGVLFNFKTTGVIVFKNHDNHLLLKFIAVYCITYAIYVSCLKIFSFYKVNMYLAGAILVLPIAILSYSLLKKFVFGGNIREV